MRMSEFAELASALDGVRESTVKGLRQWTLGGRLVARQYDTESVVVRMRFSERERLVARYPEACSIPPRFDAHMKVVLRLPKADPSMIEAALHSAWDLQRSV